MPKHEQTIALNNTNKETAFAIAYQAMKNLGWMVQFAGPDKLLGSTPKSWKNNPLQILITIAEDNLTVSSEMISGESFDMMGKNKKSTAAFLNAFNDALKSTNENTIENNKQAIETLREATTKTAEREAREAEEVDKAMHLSGGNLYITYGIIAINVLVFILMAVDGAGIFEANGLVHMKWGSNFPPLTLSGDWWRLVTNIFIHFGIIHLLMNMYCLYTVGIYLEPMLGKVKYVAAYLCTGILASIVSLWWHKEAANSAGASGAIFGMYGLFLALLTTNLIPKQVRQPLLQSIAIFVVYNLVYGMKGGVDNSAHVGGLLSGFVIGYLYVFGIKKEKQEQKVQWLVPVIVLLTIGGAYGYLQQNKIGSENRDKILTELKDLTTYKDSEKFNDKYNEFVDLQDKALPVLYDSTLKGDAYGKKLDETVMPLWEKAEALANEMKTMNVNETMLKKAQNVLEYVQLRKQELAIRKERITNESDSLLIQQNGVVDKINSIVEKLR